MKKYVINIRNGNYVTHFIKNLEYATSRNIDHAIMFTYTQAVDVALYFVKRYRDVTFCDMVEVA
jgi:hypothetical protein